MRSLLLVPLLLLTAAAPAQERRFMVGGFERLRVEGPFEVEVVPGIPGAIAVGDRAALDQVTVRTSDDILIVSGGPLSWSGRKGATLPTVRISARSLRGVALSGGARVRVAEMHGARVELLQAGAGSLDVASIRTDDLTANLNGTGTMALAGTAARAQVRNYGTGSIDASGLTAGDARLNSAGSGSIRINVRFTARANAVGSGAIDITGNPECVLRGPGPMTCTGTIRR
ncbi:head GIN domain-containing protein [Sphingomonas gei]|nr:head GIN domain-containing protein [Sphingomonas gei]